MEAGKTADQTAQDQGKIDCLKAASKHIWYRSHMKGPCTHKQALAGWKLHRKSTRCTHMPAYGRKSLVKRSLHEAAEVWHARVHA